MYPLQILLVNCSFDATLLLRMFRRVYMWGKQVETLLDLPGVTNEECHVLGSCFLGRNDQVALIFSVFVISHNDKLSLSYAMVTKKH